jgi:predicted metal-dependent phosphoesterase TrpH
MMRIDHHLHTTRLSPDSCIDPFELVEHAKRVGLDGIVITEHDALWPADELAELQAAAGPKLVVLAGVEVSADEGHFLVYGLDDLTDLEPGVPLSHLLEVVAGRGAAIVGAHPFRWGQEFDQIIADYGPVFDALELVSNNVSATTRQLTQALLDQWPMSATGSSDGHDLDVVGCYHSHFSARISDMAEFVAALRAGDVRPSASKGARLACGPV